MKDKKSAKANLEKLRTIFLELGLIAGLSLILFAFEWSNETTNIYSLGKLDNMEFDEVLIPITVRKEKKVDLPKPKPIEIIKIIDNNKDIKKEAEFESSEISQDDKIVIFDLPEDTLEFDEPFISVEENPEFPGGDEALLLFIATHIKYPEMARQIGISGIVYVEFVISKNGKVRDVSLLRGIDNLLDKEAIRVVNMLPDWIPGRQRGKAVSVRYNVPIKFILR